MCEKCVHSSGILLKLVLSLLDSVWLCGYFLAQKAPEKGELNSKMPCEAIRLSRRFAVYHFVINN